MRLFPHTGRPVLSIRSARRASDRPAFRLHRIAAQALAACGLALAAAVVAPVAAQEVRPGLWEMHPLPGDEGGGRIDLSQAQKLIERLPAEQRRQIEARLAQRGMAPGAADGTVRVCVTPEMAARLNTDGPHGDCSTARRVVRGDRTAGTGEVEVAFRCTEPESTSSGRIEIRAADHYLIDLTRLRPDGAGGQRSKRLHAEAHRVAADCGAVQPRDNLGF
jgi:hypothetical protein